MKITQNQKDITYTTENEIEMDIVDKNTIKINKYNNLDTGPFKK
jgi:hypothetical protein